MKNIDNDEDDRALRGGSWYVDTTLCHASCRDWFTPDLRSGSLGIGFRPLYRRKP
jgi:formylglycine-generating enzyme required for sulfatase activity